MSKKPKNLGTPVNYDNLVPLSLQELKEKAFIDYQTKVYNRGFFEEAGRIEFAKRKASGEEFSLVFFDVDKLKKLNDSLGHVEGNKLLSLVGEALGKGLGARDIVARYGGDEFVAIISSKAEKAIQLINSIQFPVKVSYGLAESSEAETLEELVDIADKRMYAQKKKKEDEENSVKYSDLLKRQ